MPNNLKKIDAVSSAKEIDFGFQKVAKEKKAQLVGNIFSNVAGKYDLMNDLMSFGLHRLWKDRMVSLVNPVSGNKFIDVAGGTGDIAFRIHEKAKAKNAEIKITVSDINEQMLEEGRKRSIDKNYLQGFEWVPANGENLPFPDNDFDYYTIAFGIRNFTNKDIALKEAFRILKPGGQFICMEFSPLKPGALQKIYDAYSFNVIPKIGELATQNREAYQYLVESIRQFPAPERFADMITEAGFKNVKIRPLNFGVVNIHSGWKI